MTSSLSYIALSAFDIVALVTVIGTLGCCLWIVPKPARPFLDGGLWRLLGVGLAALTFSSGALLVGRILEMSRQPIAQLPHWLPLVLKDTLFGHIWLFRAGMVLLMWLTWNLGRLPARKPTACIILFVAAAAVAFTRSATGHPADQGQWSAPEWVDFIHLMAGSLWAGGLFAMSIAVFPAIGNRAIPPNTWADLVKNLSLVATLALGGVLLTGLLASIHYLGHLSALWDTPYGRTLLIKLTLVVGAILLGAANRFFLVPRIEAAVRPRTPHPTTPLSPSDTNPLRWLAVSVAVEAIVLLGVLVAAAVLLHGMPPQEMDHTLGGSMARARETSPNARLTATRACGIVVTGASKKTGKDLMRYNNRVKARCIATI